MNPTKLTTRIVGLAVVLLVAACQDAPQPLAPDAQDGLAPAMSHHAPQDMRAWFARSSPEVLALRQTVFADHDEANNRLVFGVENPGVANAVQNVMDRLQIPASAYAIEVTEPIRFMSETLRTRHRPTMGGIQIHFGNYLCTLGFNVDHSGGRSFITNSHCTNNQGSTGTTAYYQPTSTVDSSPIAIEAHDPSYVRGGPCPRGRVCRYSDASRALYQSGTESSRGVIAKTDGENNGSLTVAGSFTVTAQNNTSTSYSGTIHKVGRTTGWSSGDVTHSCVNVNVSGTNITLLCQTMVERSGAQIAAGGDSGSPVFTRSSGDNVTLVGILWGGSSSGDLFVFSPLKNIQDELGGVTATADGSGGGDGGGGDDGGGDDGGDTCIPRGPNGNNCK
jgi:hypothetical protein